MWRGLGLRVSVMLGFVGFLAVGCCDVSPPATDSLAAGSPAAGSPAAAGSSSPAGQSVVEGQDLLGRDLIRPALGDDMRERQQKLLTEAEAVLSQDPADVEALIWKGRRTAYLGRYQEAIEIYSQGLERSDLDPQTRARLLRHRGHRLLSLRRLDKAQADFEQAAELVEGLPDRIEGDGLPNARNIPTSTLGTNIWYHLGLVHYLKADFESALVAYERCMALSENPDMRVATVYWLYMTLARLGRTQDAAKVLEPITEDWSLLENHAYHRLILAFKGQREPEALLTEASSDGPGAWATTGYGVGFAYFLQGNEERAMEVWRAVADGESWASFGHLAAEAEVARAEG